MYNPLPSTRRNACTRFRTRPPKIYEKILSFFEISFRSFSRRKFRRLFFLSGSDIYIINFGREMIFESRYTIPLPREITTRFLKLDPFPLSILSRFDRAKHFLFVCKKKRKLFFFSQLENRYTNPLRYLWYFQSDTQDWQRREKVLLSLALFAFSQFLLSNSSHFIFSHFFPAIERRYVRIVFADDNNGQTWLAWHDICSRGGFLFICAQLIRTNPRPTVWFTGLAVSEHCSKRVEAFRFAMRVGTSSRYALFD